MKKELLKASRMEWDHSPLSTWSHSFEDTKSLNQIKFSSLHNNVHEGCKFKQDKKFFFLYGSPLYKLDNV